MQWSTVSQTSRRQTMFYLTYLTMLAVAAVAIITRLASLDACLTRYPMGVYFATEISYTDTMKTMRFIVLLLALFLPFRTVLAGNMQATSMNGPAVSTAEAAHCHEQTGHAHDCGDAVNASGDNSSHHAAASSCDQHCSMVLITWPCSLATAIPDPVWVPAGHPQLVSWRLSPPLRPPLSFV